MHDVDRTLQESESEFGETEYHEQEGEQFLGDIVGGLFGGELESQGFLGEAEAEAFIGEAEAENFLGESEAVFDEVTEMELAAELLGAQSEQELEQFLGNVFKKIGSFAKGAGKALLPVLKKAAKVALPAAGAALGNLVLPGVGGALGGKLASAAGSMFGLEFEGLSPQDREFEAAKRVVRFAGTAANHLARTPVTVPPRTAIRNATVVAARKHIPGLLRPKLVASVQSAVRQQHHRRHHGRPGVRSTYVGPSYGSSIVTPGTIADGSPTPTYGSAAASYGVSGVVPSIDTPSYVGATNGSTYSTPMGYGRTGRWYRRGRKIVIVGV